VAGDAAAQGTEAPPHPARVAAMVLLPFGAGYYLSYFYRTMNAVIAPQLVSEEGLTAADLGFLTSVYFVSFASIQLPIGVALDRYGPRRVQTGLLLVAAAGGAIFATGAGFTALSIGRALIGFGVAGCFMALLKANSIWWPRARLPLVNNLSAAFGGFGALSATVPVEAALRILDWRGIFAVVAAVTVVVSALTFFVVPERSASMDRSASIALQARETGRIYRDAFFWRIGFMLAVGFAVFIAYQTLWAGPWLRDVAGFDRAGVADRLLLIQLGMLAGVLSGGVIADRLGRAGIGPTALVRAGFALFLLVQFLLVLEVTALAGLLWAGFGFFGASLFLCYSIYAHYYPPNLTGRVNTANNLVLFCLAFIAQWGIGGIIGLWPAAEDGHFAPAGHRAALIAALAVEIAAYLWFLWPRRRGRDAG